MDATIRRILENDCDLSNERLLEILDDLSCDIEMAKKFLNGEVCHCPKCDDYYLKDSFKEVQKDRVRCNVLVHQGIINSGENEYEDGYQFDTVQICPKGHERTVSSVQRTDKEISRSNGKDLWSPHW